ncbi:hypothetical protein TsFJ059_005540 [Trichoderma semiorbis]|uniref:Uncharacterized protein n=1 Tax=Trichoderma semiorbis TaxID=1491008 RepID=A0A9P8KY85_9HYPO|nr:hypothetical protein TsFJ059_005540 [Trichoderma semiorbis]
MGNAHEQPESSTAYSGTIRFNKRALDQKVNAFLDKDEEEYNSRKKAFLDIIREETHREGKNEQEIQFHILAAESMMAIKRQGRACYDRLELQEKRKTDRNEEAKIKNGRIKKNKIERKNIERKNIERKNIERKNIERKNIEEENIEEENIEEENIEKDKIENEKAEMDNNKEEEIEKDKSREEKIKEEEIEEVMKNFEEEFIKELQELNRIRWGILVKIPRLKDNGLPTEDILSTVVESLREDGMSEEFIGLVSNDILDISAQMETGNAQTRDA